MEILKEIAEKVLTGKNRDVKELCLKALDEGYSSEDILNKGLLEGMSEATSRYRNNEILITHILLAAGAMNIGTKVLEANLPADEDMNDQMARIKGKVVIGTIKGDLHDIGKNLVKVMMEKNGIEVIDLGVDVEPKEFIDAAIQNNAGVIACSALITTAMPMLKEVVDEALKRGVRDQVKIMIGGGPVTENYAQAIGADAYTDDAAEAVYKAIEFLNGSPDSD